MVGIGRICPANGPYRNTKRHVSHGRSPRFPGAPLGRGAAVGAWPPCAVKKCLPQQLPVRINFATFAWQRRARPPLGQAGAGWRLGAPRPGFGPSGQAGAGSTYIFRLWQSSQGIWRQGPWPWCLRHGRPLRAAARRGRRAWSTPPPASRCRRPASRRRPAARP